MIGAIIGDIVGSRFEWDNHRSKDFELLTHKCFFTDDSVMSLAVCDALMRCKADYGDLSEQAVRSMQSVGRPYPHCGYGGSFQRWMYSDNPKPYNSYGNGAAMRVSGCGYVGRTIDEVKQLSRAVTEVTHNHPEGLKGAEATGRCAILFPHGVLFRNEESAMREKLVRSDRVECVIGLGPNLFYNSPMEACIMICRMTKRPERRGQILFINAVNEVERKNAQSYLEDRHIQRIATAYKNYCDDGDFAKIATIQDIADNNFSLSIPLYVKPEVNEDEIDARTIQEHYDSWRAASEMMKLSYEKLNAMLGKEAEDNE